MKVNIYMFKYFFLRVWKNMDLHLSEETSFIFPATFIIPKTFWSVHPGRPVQFKYTISSDLFNATLFYVKLFQLSAHIY